jgi:hypothetical protein
MASKIICIIFIVMISCNKKGLDCYEESKIGTFERNKMILTGITPDTNIEYFEIVTGNKIVFTLNHSGFQCDQVYDDEWGEQVVFQVDGNLNNFVMKDNELERNMCFYGQFGAWVNHKKSIINAGLVEGEKIDEDEWSVNLNIKLSEPNKMGNQELEFHGIFKVKNQ